MIKNKNITVIAICTILCHWNICSYDAIINLGGDCQPTYQMGQHNIRNYALPFDHIVTPFSSLVSMLKNQCSHFLSRSFFALNEKGGRYLIDGTYNVRLLHEFDFKNPQWLSTYPDVKEKYQRRIQRLFELLNTSASILFIRKNITRDQAEQLVQLIEKLYPHLDFILLALDDHEDIKENWNIKRVINIYLQQPIPYSWKGDTTAWRNAFAKVGL